MTRSQFLFKAIDVVLYKPQNAVDYPNVTCVADIPYSDKGGSFTCADVYYDKDKLPASGKYPVLFNVHGGGFIKGDKAFRKTFCSYFANNGYLVFNINHRMPPDVLYPDIMFDCVDALNYLPELAQSYPIDLNKIVLTGDSSGGYIATFLAALKFSQELREGLSAPEIKVDIAACSPFCGMYDLERVIALPIPFGITTDLASIIFGFKVDKDFENVKAKDFYKYISPSQFINKDWCPVFLAWSQDDVLCRKQGELFAEVLKENGIKVGSYSAPGFINNHCYHLLLKTKQAKKCMAACVQYLNSVLDKN